jgi:hypothetical protein
MKFFDRVKTTTTTAGTGAVTCSATAVSNELRTLSSAGGAVNDVFPYAIGISGSAEWECGLGTITAISSGAVTFSRTPTASSNGGALVNFSTGAKEVVCSPMGATLTKWDNGTSVRVIVASAFLTSDSTLGMTPTLGSNQTAKIQALLDLAANGPLHLIWDVACTVDDIGTSQYACLLVSSNTTWEFLPNCGLVLRGSITKYMIMNKNATINPASRVDKNITFTGLAGVLHGNRDNQPVRGEALLAFYGVDGLYMNCPPEIRKAKQFSWRAANVYKVVIYKARVDFGTGSAEQNTDGYHFNGPCSDIVVKDYTPLNCGDDPLAFNADDAWGEGTFTGPFDNVYGDINNVYVDGVNVNGFLYGVRLLSGASRIDNVVIRNIRGSTGSYSVVLDNYVSPDRAMSPGPGNFGKIVIDGVYTKNTSANATPGWTKMSVHLNAKIEQISVLNVVKSDFNNENFPIVRIGEKANIDQGEIEIRSRSYNAGNYLIEQVDMAPGAQATQLRIKADVYASSAVSGSPVRVQAGATVKQLVLEGQGFNFTSMLNNQGTVSNLHDRSFMDTTAAAPSTWVLQSSAPWSEDTANPGTLTYTTSKSGVVASAKKTTSDGLGGNVKLTGNLRFNSNVAPAADIHAAPILRGNAIVPWSGVQAAYGADFYINQVGSGVSIFKVVGGTQTTIGAVIAGVLARNETYSWAFIAKGSAISLMVQRGSDSLYLQSNGTWSSTAASAFTITDTGVPAASGEWGAYMYNENTPSASIQLTNIAIAAAP